MNNNIMEKIPSEMMLYLNEIAERLWSGHATVMIGAGFSKNAKKINGTNKSFLDWSQLGNVFYKKIYGTKPNDKEHYLNVLKLANEVQAAFGRPVLDQIIRSQIPDEEYEPSKLHMKLMELPWTDVFTTNYDTLLERACVNIVSQKFDVVNCKEDLIYSEKPRIIKLHGSFPSERPFIITEEDYRKYPREFAPFVNTVQQSLLENTLCLIGFSGDDPNFLQWIGWIQDNLGKENSPKVYLIGIFNLSHAQKKLLEQRNIVLVDFSDSYDINGDYKKALNIFLDFLYFKGKSANNFRWPGKEEYINNIMGENPVEQIELVIKKWNLTRKSYPGWVILPEDRRNVLWLNTKSNINYLFNNINKLKEPNDLKFLFEFNWRIEKCLYPIFDEFIEIYEKIINRYNPFPEELDMKNLINPGDDKYKTLPWVQIKEKWLELIISVMRFYREEGLIDKWNLIDDKLQKLYNFLSPELIARLYYERCLCALFILNITEVKSRIKEWPINKSLPLWEAKRASLLAEITEVDNSKKLIEESLSNIRKQLNLLPVLNNYSLVSQESYIMELLQFVNNAISFNNGDYKIQDEDIDRFTERWNNLKQYKCDPLNEEKLFEFKLHHEPANNLNSIKKNAFDIGSSIITYKFDSTDEEALIAYSFLRYREDSGIPFRILNTTRGKEEAKGAIKRIVTYSPFWGFATLIRIGSNKAIDAVFNRESIYKMSVSEVDSLINDYLSVLKNSLPEISLGNKFKLDKFSLVLARLIPDILSRLCVKCSDDARIKLLDFLNEIYYCKYKNKFKGISKLVKRLIYSLSDKKLYELLPRFLEFPILINTDEFSKSEFPDPFNFIWINNKFENESINIEIDDGIITKLIKNINGNIEERKIATKRLEILYKLRLLNEEQIKSFSESLWSQKDKETNFPKDTSFYKCAFISLPHPEGINPNNLFKNFILKEHFPLIKKGKVIPITGRNIPLANEIINATRNGVKWSEEEALNIFNKLLEWWNSDKNYVKKDDGIKIFGSVADEFCSRFKYLVSIISKIIAPVFSTSTDKETKNKIVNLISEVNEYRIPCLQAKAACIQFIDYEEDDIYLDIVDAISSKYHFNILDALYAILELLKIKNSSEKLRIETNKILFFLSEQIRVRIQEGLVSSLNMMSIIVSQYSKYLNKKVLSGVLIGLKYLCEESNPLYIGNKIDISDKLLYRESAAHLAFELFQYYSEKKENIPQIIKEWKNICLDENEFIEIRNQWIEK